MAVFSAIGGMLGADRAQAGGQQASQMSLLGGMLAAQREQEMFNQGLSYVQPYQQQGIPAMRAINDVLGLSAYGAPGYASAAQTPAMQAQGGGGAANPNGVAGSSMAQYGQTGAAAGLSGATGAPTSGQLGLGRIATPENPFDPNAIGAGFRSSPGYNFMLDQGRQAIDASAAARGGLLSGANIKAQTDYATGLANQDYWNYIGQQQQGMGLDYAQRADAFNRIAGQEQVGAGAAGSIFGGAVTSGGQQGQAIAQGYSGAADALSSAGRAAGQAMQSGISSGMGNLVGFLRPQGKVR